VSNPRKNSYGYTIRINTGIDMAEFQGAAGRDISLHVSSSAAGGGGFVLNLSASTLFIGNSTVYSSTEGLTFTSGQWVYGQNLTAQAFATADDYNAWIIASATGKNFISPIAVITVDA
jgi:hypothetical protein